MSEPVLSVRDLAVTFETREGTVNAVNGVSFAVRRGEVLGLVGESGSGKSVTGLADPRASSTRLGASRADRSGSKARNSSAGLTAEMQRLRGKRLAMIFQDPDERP